MSAAILQDHASVVASANREPVPFLIGALENWPGIAFAVQLEPQFRARCMLAHHLPRLLIVSNQRWISFSSVRRKFRCFRSIRFASDAVRFHHVWEVSPSGTPFR